MATQKRPLPSKNTARRSIDRTIEDIYSQEFVDRAFEDINLPSSDELTWLENGSAGGALGTAAYEDAADLVSQSDLGAVQTDLDTLEAALIPVAPVIAATASYTTITVSWTYTAIAPITGFKLYRKEGISGTYALITSPASGDTSYVDAGLTDNTTYYYRLDAYNTFFTTASNEPSATTEAVSFDFSLLPDGALPAIFTGSTWAISSGAAVNTPTLGSEIITNGDFDTDTDWNKGAGWSIADGIASKASTAANALLTQPSKLTANLWYRAGWDLVAKTADSIQTYFGGVGSLGDSQSLGSRVDTNFSAGTAAGIRATNTSVGEVDNISFKQIPVAQMFAVIDAGRNGKTVEANLSYTKGVLAGVVLCLDSVANPQNYVLATYTGSLARIIKCVGGTHTVVLNTPAPPSAGAALKLVQEAGDSTQFSVYWNGLKISTTQTISDAGIISNTIHGLFSTDPLSTFGGTFKLSDTDELDTITASHALAALTTPTYDGSGAAIHCDIYDAGSGSTFNGYRYWMAFTPYFDRNNLYENPSILASVDGDTWEEPAGISNPISPNPGSGFQSDTDIIVADSIMYIFYGYSGDGFLRYRSSSDGVTWSAETVLPFGTNERSPAVIAYDGGFRMFTNYGTAAPYDLRMRTATSITGPWSEPVTCALDTDSPYTVWHLDVINDSGTLYALMQMYVPGGTLNIGRSGDGGLTWTVRKQPTLTYFGAPAWATGGLYRGSIVRNSTGFDCWYSGLDSGSSGGAVQWNIGRTSIVMS